MVYTKFAHIVSAHSKSQIPIHNVHPIRNILFATSLPHFTLLIAYILMYMEFQNSIQPTES